MEACARARKSAMVMRTIILLLSYIKLRFCEGYKPSSTPTRLIRKIRVRSRVVIATIEAVMNALFKPIIRLLLSSIFVDSSARAKDYKKKRSGVDIPTGGLRALYSICNVGTARPASQSSPKHLGHRR
jgi:hypothetical protein